MYNTIVVTHVDAVLAVGVCHGTHPPLASDTLAVGVCHGTHPPLACDTLAVGACHGTHPPLASDTLAVGVVVPKEVLPIDTSDLLPSVDVAQHFNARRTAPRSNELRQQCHG